MTDPNNRRAFSTIVAAACVDGELSPPEREVIHRKATEYDIPVGVMREIIDLGVQGRLAVTVPPGQAERETLFDDLIDVACADGRIEAPEHHLLAKFAAHLGLQLSDLRARVRQRLQQKPAVKPAPPPSAPRPAVRQEPRPEPPPRPTVREERRPEPPRPPAAPDRPVAPPTPPAPEIPAYVPGPITLLAPLIGTPEVADVPPVTLHLLKQAILFETAPDAVRYIERTLAVTKPEAEALMRKILEIFPDLKPGSQQLRSTIPPAFKKK